MLLVPKWTLWTTSSGKKFGYFDYLDVFHFYLKNDLVYLYLFFFLGADLNLYLSIQTQKGSVVVVNLL